MDAHCLRRFIDGEPLVMMKQHRLPFLNRQGQHVKIQIVILFGHGPAASSLSSGFTRRTHAERR